MPPLIPLGSRCLIRRGGNSCDNVSNDTRRNANWLAGSSKSQQCLQQGNELGLARRSELPTVEKRGLQKSSHIWSDQNELEFPDLFTWISCESPHNFQGENKEKFCLINLLQSNRDIIGAPRVPALLLHLSRYPPTCRGPHIEVHVQSYQCGFSVPSWLKSVPSDKRPFI